MSPLRYSTLLAPQRFRLRKTRHQRRLAGLAERTPDRLDRLGEPAVAIHHQELPPQQRKRRAQSARPCPEASRRRSCRRWRDRSGCRRPRNPRSANPDTRSRSPPRECLRRAAAAAGEPRNGSPAIGISDFGCRGGQRAEAASPVPPASRASRGGQCAAQVQRDGVFRS